MMGKDVDSGIIYSSGSRCKGRWTRWGGGSTEACGFREVFSWVCVCMIMETLWEGKLNDAREDGKLPRCIFEETRGD